MFLNCGLASYSDHSHLLKLPDLYSDINQPEDLTGGLSPSFGVSSLSCPSPSSLYFTHSEVPVLLELRFLVLDMIRRALGARLLQAGPHIITVI